MVIKEINSKTFKVIKGKYRISNSKRKLQLDMIHKYLEDSYWCKNIPKSMLRKSIKGSVCFGVYHKKQQVGFARVVTDKATFGYLADVFILPEYQGKGLGKWLIETIMDYKEFRYFRSWSLATRDAHDLYKKFGFKSLKTPEMHMRKVLFTAY